MVTIPKPLQYYRRVFYVDGDIELTSWGYRFETKPTEDKNGKYVWNYERDSYDFILPNGVIYGKNNLARELQRYKDFKKRIAAPENVARCAKKCCVRQILNDFFYFVRWPES
jgi:hypothetical protein